MRLTANHTIRHVSGKNSFPLKILWNVYTGIGLHRGNVAMSHYESKCRIESPNMRHKAAISEYRCSYIKIS